MEDKGIPRATVTPGFDLVLCLWFFEELNFVDSAIHQSSIFCSQCMIFMFNFVFVPLIEKVSILHDLFAFFHLFTDAHFSILLVCVWTRHYDLLHVQQLKVTSIIWFLDVTVALYMSRNHLLIMLLLLSHRTNHFSFDTLPVFLFELFYIDL